MAEMGAVIQTVIIEADLCCLELNFDVTNEPSTGYRSIHRSILGVMISNARLPIHLLNSVYATYVFAF